MNDLEQIVAGIANDRWGLGLSPAQLAQMSRYAEMLAEWNQRMNLTRIVDPHGIAVKHFLDSLALLHVARVPEQARLIDIGAGAGFPGLPLKIARPDVDVVLLDSTAKKLAFCDAVIADLGLAGIGTIHGRAEDLADRPEHAHAYDVAAARAVAALDRLLGWCGPFVRPGGAVAAWKGPSVAGELAAARPVAHRLGLRLAEPVPVDLPGEDAAAHFLVLARRASGLQRRRVERA